MTTSQEPLSNYTTPT